MYLLACGFRNPELDMGCLCFKISSNCISDVKITASLVAPHSRSVVLALSKTVKTGGDI